MKKIVLIFLLLMLIAGCSKGMKELSCCTKCIENHEESSGNQCIDQEYEDLSKFCNKFFESNNADLEYCQNRWSEAK